MRWLVGITLSLITVHVGADVCFPGRVSGLMDVQSPFPLNLHRERYTQIQRALAANGRKFYMCLEFNGELSDPVNFSVMGDGRAQVVERTISSNAAQCMRRVLERINFGGYACDFNVMFRWNGKFPLVSEHGTGLQFAPATNE